MTTSEAAQAKPLIQAKPLLARHAPRPASGETSPRFWFQRRPAEGEGRHMRRGDNSVTPIEALYDRARIDPNGTAFMVGHDRWEYGDVTAQVQRLSLIHI